MIMMRSTPVTKMPKPPPPVPPRPSKAIISEALAKSKKLEKVIAPSRLAPPPPVVNGTSDATNNKIDLEKSKSHSGVNLLVRKPTLERSISEEKGAQRTVVFQSSDMKSSKIQVNLVRKPSFKKEAGVGVQQVPKNSTEAVRIEAENTNTKVDKNWNEVLNDRNHVNTLIDEMFASVLELPDDAEDDHKPKNPAPEENDKVILNTEEKVQINQTKPTTVVILNKEKEETKSNSSTGDRRKVQFDDKKNHEYLISELQSMKKEQERIMRRQRKPSQEFFEEVPNIHHSDWIELTNGQEIRLSSCQITLEDKECSDILDPDIISRLSAMSSLHGLPPLPKSLSGFSLMEDESAGAAARPGTSRGTTPPTGQGQHLVYPPHPKQAAAGADGRKTTNLDMQLAILRKEMYSLRQLDLSLLSQLWSLNESIQDFRQMLQDQDDRMMSPPSTSQTASSDEDEEVDEFYSPSPMRFRPAPPPPPLRRPSNSSSGTSSV